MLQVVKGYPEGKMSKHIVNLNVGDTLECKGPISKLPYKPNMKKKIGMVRACLERTVRTTCCQTLPQWELVLLGCIPALATFQVTTAKCIQSATA